MQGITCLALVFFGSRTLLELKKNDHYRMIRLMHMLSIIIGPTSVTTLGVGLGSLTIRLTATCTPYGSDRDPKNWPRV